MRTVYYPATIIIISTHLVWVLTIPRLYSILSIKRCFITWVFTSIQNSILKLLGRILRCPGVQLYTVEIRGLTTNSLVVAVPVLQYVVARCQCKDISLVQQATLDVR